MRERLGAKDVLPSGAHLGAESLTEALISFGAVDRCDLFLLPTARFSHGERFARLTRVGVGPLEVRVRPYHELISALSNGEISLWFDPHGALVLPHEARQSISSNIFPIVSTFHHLNFPAMLHSWILRGLFASAYSCDSIVCPSHASQKALAKIFEQIAERIKLEFGALVKFQPRISTIPTCVDTVRFHPCDKCRVRRDNGLPTDRPLIAYAGRISLADKVDLAPLLLAFGELIRSDPGLDPLLLIAGSDRKGELQALNRMAAALEIGDKIRLIGSVPHEEMQRVLAAADVFVSPTDTVQENLPLTLLEAMLCGVPQVAPDWDGYREAVSHGESGFLVPTYWTRCDTQLSAMRSFLGWEHDYLTLSQSVAFDVKAMKTYLGALIANEELRIEMGRRSRARAEKLYSYPAVITQYESLWRELLEVARGISLHSRDSRFNEPTYFDWYGHFASSLLDDRVKLVITQRGLDAVKRGRILFPYEGLKQLGILNETLILGLLQEFAGSAGKEQPDAPPAGSQTTPSPSELGEIVRRQTHLNRCQAEEVRRHAMWLLKYGLIEVVP